MNKDNKQRPTKQEKLSKKAGGRNDYGMDDYSDIEPMSDDDAKKRRKRSVAIAAVLGFLIVIFYITTITRLSENIKQHSLKTKKTTQSFIIHQAGKQQIAFLEHRQAGT